MSKLSSNSWLDIPTVYLSDEKPNPITLRQIHASNPNSYMVIDFWHSHCVNCPGALDKLNKESSVNEDDIIYVAVALSQGEDNFEFALELSDGQWENLIKVYMDVENKEKVKELLDFKAVPYYVVVGKNDEMLAKGYPRTVDIKAVIQKSREDLLVSENINSNKTQSFSSYEFKLDEDF